METILTLLLILFVIYSISKYIKYIGYIVVFIAIIYGIYHLCKLFKLIRQKNKQDILDAKKESVIAKAEGIDNQNIVYSNIINQHTPYKDNSAVRSKKYKSDKNKEYDKQKLDTFMWQCNSIATLRDSNSIGYEYTNLNNPDDLLEIGYRDALLEISDYNKIPLIKYSNDRYAPGGYIKRTMIDMRRDYEYCENIYIENGPPIVCKLPTITRCIDTMVFKSPDDSIGRTVTETFFYKILDEYQDEFLDIVDRINSAFKSNNQEKYLISLSDIKFTKTANKYVKYALPLSLIIYDTDKRLFNYKFSNEIIIPGEYSETYQYTETGSIIYTEDSVLKKASCTKIIDGVRFICRFKNYKTGFDLYDIRSNGNILYKRNK